MLYIFLSIGVGALLIIGGITYRSKKQNLLNNGKVAHAIIFKMEQQEHGYHPVVRFLTEDKRWITHELKTGFDLDSYKEGDNIDVIYDPDDLTNIEIHQPGLISFLSVLPIILGITFFLFGLYKFITY